MSVARIVNPPDPLLTAEEAAAYLGVKTDTLAKWRATNRYPLPYVKVGRHVRYRSSDLQAWLESRTVQAVSL